MAKSIEPINKGAAADLIAAAGSIPDPVQPESKTQEPTTITQESCVSNNAEQLNPADLAEFLEWKKAKNKPQAIDTTTEEEKKEAELLKQYGKGFIQAIRKGKDGKLMRNVFTATTWGLMSRDKDGKRDGWEKEVKTPPEVSGL